MDDLIVSGWLETTAGDGTRWCRALPAPKPSHTIQGEFEPAQGEFEPAPTTSMRRVGVLKRGTVGPLWGPQSFALARPGL